MSFFSRKVCSNLDLRVNLNKSIDTGCLTCLTCRTEGLRGDVGQVTGTSELDLTAPAAAAGGRESGDGEVQLFFFPLGLDC